MSVEQKLDPCNCCEEISVLTPQALENLPGLSQLVYRVGTHAIFKSAMLAHLPGQPNLGLLTTRGDDDPSIALLDAAATLLDVLTFYQERIANEGYLRTAVERRSVLELARAIGYELNPGVAASTFLAFMMETSAGAPASALIPKGTRGLSIPEQDQLPQPFETVEELEARPEWNSLRPAQVQYHRPSFGDRKVYLAGIANNLKPGDSLLIVGDERLERPRSDNWDFRRIKSLQTIQASETVPAYTVVTLEYGLGEPVPFKEPAKRNPRVYVLRGRASLFGYNAPDFRAMPDNVQKNYGSPSGSEWPGFNIHSISGPATDEEPGTQYIHLDALYPQITPESWVILSHRDYVELFQVKKTAEDAKADFAMSAKTTRLLLLGENLYREFGGKIRETVVHIQSEELAFADLPLEDPVDGDHLMLDRYLTELLPRRRLVVSGRRMRAVVTTDTPLKLRSLDSSEEADLSFEESLVVMASPVETGRMARKTWTLQNKDGLVGTVTAYPAQIAFAPAREDDPFTSEPAQIKEIIQDPSLTPGEFTTTLVLEKPLQSSFDRRTVTVFANVALSTHGETKIETLGSGDASRIFQKFVLKNKPLTYTPSSSASGGESSLEVRVNDILWEEVPSLYGVGPRERVYITRLADDGAVTIQFGDGINGARLPSGADNVRATYRAGIGQGGMLHAGQLSLLVKRPLGVQKVNSQLAPSGAADPQVLDDARQNAPFTVLTLDRIVSLQDFEDFARAFSGIGKAQSTWLWDGEARIVHLTVAAAASTDGSDYTIASNSTLYQFLSAAIDAARDTTQPLQIDTYLPLFFRAKISLVIDPTYIPEKVMADVESLLQERYAFEQRGFGQPVHQSDVLAAVQSAEGVVAVYLDELYLRGREPSKEDVLVARRAELDGDSIRQAELLLIDPHGITILEAAA
jgi:hypothetical protein